MNWFSYRFIYEATSRNAEGGKVLSTATKFTTSLTDDPKSVIEEFKSGFGASVASSTYEWALSDLSTAMVAEMDNAAAFVDAYWSTIEILDQRGVAVPSEIPINDILHKHEIPLTIRPPHLVLEGDDSILIEKKDAIQGIVIRHRTIY